MTDREFKQNLHTRDRRVIKEVIDRIAEMAEATQDGAANWTLREAALDFSKRIVKEFEGRTN